MKIAVCSYDLFEPVLDAVRRSKFEVARVWSFEVDNCFDSYNIATEVFAHESGARFSLQSISAADVSAMEAEGIQLVLVAGYKYKIPIPKNSSIRFVNTHGTLLPEGKGLWPQPWLLLKHPSLAGVTLHEMTNQWDTGAILLQKSISVNAAEDINSLSLKTARLAGELVFQLLSDFHKIWATRTSMNLTGSYWKLPTFSERILDPLLPVADLVKIYNAFGRWAVFRDPQRNLYWTVGSLTVLFEASAAQPGEILSRSNRNVLVAAKGGIVAIALLNVIQPLCENQVNAE